MPKGDVRAALLALLHEQPRNGYQLMQAIAERSGGRWKPSPGSVYPTLAQLEEEGLVTTTGSGTARRCQLTDAGRAFVAAHPDRVNEPWASATRLVPDAVAGVRGTLDALVEVVHQVTTTGTEEQVAWTDQVLASARRDVTRILAGDDAAR